MAPLDIIESLASIDKKLAVLEQRLSDHTDQDADNFARISIQLEEMSRTLVEIRIAEAGVAGRTQKNVNNWATLVNSLVISFMVLVEIWRYSVGGV